MEKTPEQLAAEERALQLRIATYDFGDRFAEDELRGTRDLRTGRFITHSDYGADDQLIVQFSRDAVLNKRETVLAGTPKYTEMDFITINVPGNKDLTVHTAMNDFYEWRFGKEYEAWKNGQGEALTGTPLIAWPEMSPSLIKELDHYGIRTVEQIANLSDSTSGVLRNFYAMKNKAKLFLESTKESSQAAVLKDELSKQDEAHKQEIAALNAKLAQLMEMMQPAEVKPIKKTKLEVVNPDDK